MRSFAFIDVWNRTNSFLNAASERVIAYLGVPAVPAAVAAELGGGADTYVGRGARLAPAMMVRAQARLARISTDLAAARAQLNDHDNRQRSLEMKRDICALFAVLAVFGMLATNPAFIVVAAPCIWFGWDVFKQAAAHEAARGPLQQAVLRLEAKEAAIRELLHDWRPRRLRPQPQPQPAGPGSPHSGGSGSDASDGSSTSWSSAHSSLDEPRPDSGMAVRRRRAAAQRGPAGSTP